VTGTKRSASLPDVPTIAESGVPGYEFTTWYGLVAPRHTPAPIVQRLNAAVATTLAAADTRSRLQKTGLDPQASTPAEFGKLIRAEIVKWRKVIEVAAIPKQ
jgi:tripartite-type tricarboxylate transporter receptor subunit TctC